MRLLAWHHLFLALLALGVNCANAVVRPKWVPRIKMKGRLRGLGVGGEESGTELDKDAGNKTLAVCSEPFPSLHRFSTACPEECPLQRFAADMICHWKCITEAECHSFESGVINREDGLCAVCLIPGCSECSRTEQKCIGCGEGFHEVDGSCVNNNLWRWHALFMAMGGIVCVVIVYIVALALRPVLNPDGLDKALRHRSRAKARNDVPPHDLYPLSMSLCEHETVGGVGTLLHFCWQRMMIFWAIFVFIVIGTVTLWNSPLILASVIQSPPQHDEALGTCEGFRDASAGDIERERIHYLWATGIVYVASFVGAIVWAILQRKKFARYDEKTTSMRDYAILCSGFPVETEGEACASGERLEEEYLEFLRQQPAWGDDVLGVSIVWDYSDKVDEVRVMTALIHDSLDCERSLATVESASNIVQPRIGRLNSSTWNVWMRPLDNLLLGRDGTEEVDDTDEKRSRQALTLLAELKTTGYAFAILKDEVSRDNKLGLPLPKFRGKHEITATMHDGEAETVVWEAFSVTTEQRRTRIILACLSMCVAILIWAFCFWSPYYLYVAGWSNTAGMSGGYASQGLVLGLVITLGNQLIYAVCDYLSDKVQFTCRDDRDMFYVGLYTSSVLINTALDLWLVSQMAIGWQQDSHVNPEALVRNPSMQHALFVQLALYLWPAALLYPFLAEPLIISVLPYFVGQWFVRSTPCMRVYEAELFLQPMAFDLNRYGDILINVSMVTCCFFLTAINLWWVFAMLVISNAFIYTWDSYRFKRVNRRTHFATQSVEVLSQYMTVVPCAILAGALMFKISGGQGLVKAWGSDDFFNDHPFIWRDVVIAAVAHMVVHTLLLSFVVPKCSATASLIGERGDRADVRDYQDTAATVACNWFNANPIHCLRSEFIYEHFPAHVFYQQGKEHLHMRNVDDPKALIIYEAGRYTKEKSITSDVREWSTTTTTGMKNTWRRTKAKISLATKRKSDAGEESERGVTSAKSYLNSTRGPTVDT